MLPEIMIDQYISAGERINGNCRMDWGVCMPHGVTKGRGRTIPRPYGGGNSAIGALGINMFIADVSHTAQQIIFHLLKRQIEK